MLNPSKAQNLPLCIVGARILKRGQSLTRKRGQAHSDGEEMARYHRPPRVKLWKNPQSSHWWLRFYQEGKIRCETTGIPFDEKKRLCSFP